jgi:peroxiredoxin
MKKLSLYSGILATICLTFFFFACNQDIQRTAKKVTDVEVPNFGLYDNHGGFHRLHYYDEAPAIVLFVQGNKCPIVRNAFTDFQKIESEFEARGVKFFMINSNIQDTRESVAAEMASYKVNTPVLVDEDQLVADALDLDITAEAFVINPKDWSIAYRGPINDRIGYESQKNDASKHYLKEAISATIGNNPVENSFVNTKGCAIARKSKHEGGDELTYTDDIAPIFLDNCYSCHQEGGIAPWAMEGFPAVYGWSAMIKQVLLEDRMPPWQADPHYESFKDDLSLTAEEKRKIISWIDNGMKKGEGEDVLAEASPNASEWTLGEPDYVIELNTEDIPATGIIDYRYQTHKLPFDKDVYLSAYQVLPGNPNVLHHILANVEYPKGEDFPVKERKSPWLDGILFGWAPGGTPDVFPKNSGRKIPAGSAIHFQNHYTTSGKAESDGSKIGLYFVKDDVPEKEFITVGPANFNIKIPPHAAEAAFKAEHIFEKDVTLYQSFPHMHYRGKSMNFVLEFPDGTSRKVLNVPGYNFNWQRFYSYENPISIPAGSKMIVNAVFDNSEQNEFNPDPTKTLYFGQQTFDEMLVGYLSYTVDEEKRDLSFVAPK